MWELRAILRGYERRNRDILTMMRNLGYWTLLAQGGQKFAAETSPEDLVRFSWEKPTLTDISDEEYNQLQDLIQQENERLPNERSSNHDCQDR